jgi:hypothetical protein
MKSRALLLLVCATQLTCHQALFTAPPGTEMSCIGNPPFIPAFNGVSVISCILIEQAGTPVADGTVVQFFTNLGRIPEQGRTNDGVVRVNLESDGRSGQATVSVVSGGGTITTTPSTSTPGSSTTTLPVQRGLASSALAGSWTASALLANDTVDVTIGSVNARSVLVAAFPNRLTDSRTSQITANVFDQFGNPAPGVPVFFTVEDAVIIGPGPTPGPGTPTPLPTGTPTSPGGGDAVFEHMDSQGQPVFTDSNGQARDVLRTRYPREALQRRVTVRARIPIGGIEGSTTVIIN